MTIEAQAPAELNNRDDSAPTGRVYAGYVLALLVVVNMMNSVDRAVVNILVEPIRLELGFNDTQIGLIGGLGFALVYGILGLPIARLADRGNRKRLLAAGLAAWSIMTYFTGRAVGFWSMLLARVGVGAGESTCYPASLSLISDYFKPEYRPRAIAIFQLGLHLGYIAGAIVASTVAAKYGWRAAFTVFAIPGVVLSGIMLLTLREPVRGALDPSSIPRSNDVGFMHAARVLFTDRPFMMLAASGMFMALGTATLANWGAAYMMRSHDLTQLQVGAILAPAMGGAGLIGTLIGGFLGTIIAKRSARTHAPLLVMLFTALPGVPAMAIFLMAPTVPIAVTAGFCGGLLTSMHFGSLMAVALNRISSEYRGMAASILVIGQTVIGFGFGPLIAGIVSDALSGQLGEESLRYAMLMAPVFVFTGWAICLMTYRLLNKTDGRIATER